MVEDVDFIFDWRTSRNQSVNCLNNLLLFHVATLLILAEYHENSSVLAVNHLNQIVQIFKIVMILCQNHAPIAIRLCELHHVACTLGT